MRTFAMVWTAVAVATMAVSGPAMAQGSTAKATEKKVAPATPAPAAKPAAKAESGYEYRFDDDLMKGDTLGANAPRITVRKAARRDQLIRPRLHFVPEMQKSVEAM